MSPVLNPTAWLVTVDEDREVTDHFESNLSLGDPEYSLGDNSSASRFPIWVIHVLLTVIIISVFLGSFLRFHFQNKTRYVERALRELLLSGEQLGGSFEKFLKVKKMTDIPDRSKVIDTDVFSYGHEVPQKTLGYKPSVILPPLTLQHEPSIDNIEEETPEDSGEQTEVAVTESSTEGTSKPKRPKAKVMFAVPSESDRSLSEEEKKPRLSMKYVTRRQSSVTPQTEFCMKQYRMHRRLEMYYTKVDVDWVLQEAQKEDQAAWHEQFDPSDDNYMKEYPPFGGFSTPMPSNNTTTGGITRPKIDFLFPVASPRFKKKFSMSQD